MKKLCAMTKQIKCENQLNHLKEINKNPIWFFQRESKKSALLRLWVIHHIAETLTLLTKD